MEQVPQKTWTMKHPALAKAFAVAFAVMSLIMLAAGFNGIGEAKEENAERLRYEKRYAERIDNYAELVTRLENSITYEALWDELEKEVEQHDKDASQHRTDLALNTAGRGGYTMGADMIWEAVPDFNASRRELAIAKQMLQAQEDNIAMLKSAVEGLTPVEAASNGLGELISHLDGLITMMENPPVVVSVPTENKTVALSQSENDKEPVSDEPAEEPLEEADEEAVEETAEQPAGKKQETPIVEQPVEEQAIEEASEEEAAEEPVKEEPAEEEIVEEPDEEEKGSIPPAEDIAYSKHNIRIRYAGSATDPATMLAGIHSAASQLFPPEQPLPGLDAFGTEPLNQTYALKTALQEAKAGYDDALSNVFNTGMSLNKMREALAQYEAGVAAIEAGEAGLDMAWGQLENIWYELDQLDEERDELILTRDRLNEEAAKLSKEVMEADQLRELENDRTSAKLLLTSVKEVRDQVNAGAEIIPTAQQYLEDYKADTKLQYYGRLISCAFAIIGGIAGIAGIPAVYEFTRKRAWLIIPVIVCAACAVLAEGIYYGVGLGWWYVGMFTAIIALLHLLIVLPKEKKPGMIK